MRSLRRCVIIERGFSKVDHVKVGAMPAEQENGPANEAVPKDMKFFPINIWLGCRHEDTKWVGTAKEKEIIAELITREWVSGVGLCIGRLLGARSRMHRCRSKQGIVHRPNVFVIYSRPCGRKTRKGGIFLSHSPLSGGGIKD